MVMSSNHEVIELLKTKKSFHIVSHYNPDGDSIGSALALGTVLKYNDKHVEVFCLDPVPEKYTFLTNSSNALSDLSDIDPSGVILVVLDCSDISRTGLTKERIDNYDLVINIDHHKTNEYFGDINLVLPEASATGEIIFELIKQGDMKLDFHIAQALYVAISTDTGSFKFENTTSRTHEVIAEIMTYDIQHSQIAQQVFDEKPLPYFFLLKNALSSLEFWHEGKVSCITISKELLSQIGANLEMLDGIVNYAKNINTVEIGILFYIAEKNEVKVGMRSKNVDISIIAERFNGGGHARAAGFRAMEAYPYVKNTTIQAASELINEYYNEN